MPLPDSCSATNQPLNHRISAGKQRIGHRGRELWRPAFSQDEATVDVGTLGDMRLVRAAAVERMCRILHGEVTDAGTAAFERPSDHKLLIPEIC